MQIRAVPQYIRVMVVRCEKKRRSDLAKQPSKANIRFSADDFGVRTSEDGRTNFRPHTAKYAVHKEKE